MIRYVTIPTAAIGALALLVHLASKLTGHGDMNANDAMAILVLAGVAHIIGTRR
jgi:hypothetical protein